MIHLKNSTQSLSSPIDGFKNHYTKIEGSIDAIIKENSSIFLQCVTTVCNRDKHMYALRGGLSFSF